jgi:4-diphosphocytidyl-2-C-methyl-D-erythritol kinase
MHIEARAYAKINLGLLIHNRRTDGYHEIETVFHRIDLFDHLVFEPADEISIVVDSSDVPADESNLCWKAAALVNKLAGTNYGAKITLTKNIPVGAGLGGGSSDAACTLRLLPRLWNTRMSSVQLARAAIQLGADVPYFLGTGSAHGTGRGEILDFFRLDLPYAIVVCFPGIPVSTPWAYQQIKAFGTRESGSLAKRIDSTLGRPVDLCRVIENDFEGPVFHRYPAIAATRTALIESGAFCAALSGSGSSVYGLFSDERVAVRAAAALRSDRIQTFLTPAGFQLPVEPTPA